MTLLMLLPLLLKPSGGAAMAGENSGMAQTIFRRYGQSTIQIKGAALLRPR
jgi:hypothetical protein